MRRIWFVLGALALPLAACERHTVSYDLAQAESCSPGELRQGKCTPAPAPAVRQSTGDDRPIQTYR